MLFMLSGALFKLDADPLNVDGALVPIPGDGLDADLRDSAPKAPVAIDQGSLRTFARGADETARPRAVPRRSGPGAPAATRPAICASAARLVASVGSLRRNHHAGRR